MMPSEITVTRINNQELINKFESELDIIKNRQTTLGLEEFVLDRERRVGKREGVEEGKEIMDYENKLNFAKNLLPQTDFSEEKIAVLVGVDIEFVQKVKASLK